MALPFEELEVQSAEILPAREVMSSVGSSYWGPMSNVYTGGIANGTNIQDVTLPLPIPPDDTDGVIPG